MSGVWRRSVATSQKQIGDGNQRRFNAKQLSISIAQGCFYILKNVCCIGYIHARTRIFTHAHIQTRTHTHAHTHTRTHAHTRTYAHTHTHAQTRTHALTHSRTHALTHSHKHTHTHARTHARTHAHTHTHTHTHTRMTTSARPTELTADNHSRPFLFSLLPEVAFSSVSRFLMLRWKCLRRCYGYGSYSSVLQWW